MLLAGITKMFKPIVPLLSSEVCLGQQYRGMATLKAIDPQIVLQRGFALVYGTNGALIRSINNVTEKQTITTRLADGKLISEVTAKEANFE